MFINSKIKKKILIKFIISKHFIQLYSYFRSKLKLICLHRYVIFESTAIAYYDTATISNTTFAFTRWRWTAPTTLFDNINIVLLWLHEFNPDAPCLFPQYFLIYNPDSSKLNIACRCTLSSPRQSRATCCISHSAQPTGDLFYSACVHYIGEIEHYYKLVYLLLNTRITYDIFHTCKNSQ